MSGNKICETCSCEITALGTIVVHDETAWLTSPIPCPACMERALEKWSN